MQGWQCDKRPVHCILLGGLLVFGISGGIGCWGQVGPAGATSPGVKADLPEATSVSLGQWDGLPVRRISFEGVSAGRLTPLPGHLAQAEGAPLSRENLEKSLRQLFSTGLFETIEVEGERDRTAWPWSFAEPRAPSSARSAWTAPRASRSIRNWSAPANWRPAPALPRPNSIRLLEQMRATLAQNGFHEPVITHTLTAHPEEQLVDIAFHVVTGPQARVGAVEVTGDPGMSVEAFRSPCAPESRCARGPRNRQPGPGRGAQGLPGPGAAGS